MQNCIRNNDVITHPSGMKLMSYSMNRVKESGFIESL